MNACVRACMCMCVRACMCMCVSACVSVVEGEPKRGQDTIRGDTLDVEGNHSQLRTSSFRSTQQSPLHLMTRDVMCRDVGRAA